MKTTMDNTDKIAYLYALKYSLVHFENFEKIANKIIDNLDIFTTEELSELMLHLKLFCEHINSYERLELFSEKLTNKLLDPKIDFISILEEVIESRKE